MGAIKQKKTEALKLIDQTERDIHFARQSGISCDNCEKILKAGQTKLESAQTMEDYDAAMDLIESADRSLKRTKLQHQKSSQLIAAINKKYSELEKQGIFIKNIHEHIKSARDALDKSNYGETITISKEILSNIENTVQAYMLASDLIKLAESKINLARSFEAETSEAEGFLNKAKEQLEANDYSKAHRLAQESIRISESARDEQVGRFKQRADGQLKDLEKEIFELKKLGADAGKCEFILKKIKASLKNNDFRAAFDYFGNCKTSALESKRQLLGARDKLSRAKQVIIDAQRSGADITKAKQNYMNAETALKKHDYKALESFIDTTISFAEKAQDAHRNLMSEKEKAEEIVDTAKSRITEARDSGIKVSAVLEFLEKGEDALMRSNYPYAQEMGQQVIDSIKELQEQHAEAQESILKAENSITELKAFVDTSEAEQFLTMAIESNEAGNYPEAIEFAQKTVKGIDQIKTNDKPHLKVSFEDLPEFQTGTWTKCILELYNKGKVHARDVNISISEKVEVRGLTSIPDLEAGQNKTLELELRTAEAGEHFIDIVISFTNPITNDKIETKKIIRLKTVRDQMTG